MTCSSTAIVAVMSCETAVAPGKAERRCRTGTHAGAACSASARSPQCARTTRLTTLLVEGRSLANSDAQTALGIDATTARLSLAALVAAGQTTVSGMGRGTTYRAVPGHSSPEAPTA